MGVWPALCVGARARLQSKSPIVLTFTPKQRRLAGMSSRGLIITSCVSMLVLGSVMAFAQSTPPEASVETVPDAPPAAPEPAPPIPAAPPQFAKQADPAPVEDAPIDVPDAGQADWAPDINLDAQNQADSVQKPTQRKAKPRKILSDAGENPLGTNSWNAPGNAEAAQAALLSRATRRERAIDPVKRSQLTRLARVMGALHALRVSCSGRDDQTYRSRMATMLDLEAPDSGELRDPLVDAFNGGFQVYGRGANTCPADARAQEAALAKDGFGLARTMSARYRPIPKEAAVLPPANQPRKNAPPIVPAKAAGGVAPTASTVKPSPVAQPARPGWNAPEPN